MTLDDLPRTNHARMTYAARLRTLTERELLDEHTKVLGVLGACGRRRFRIDERVDAIAATLELVKQERGRRNPGLARIWSLPLNA